MPFEIRQCLDGRIRGHNQAHGILLEDCRDVDGWNIFVTGGQQLIATSEHEGIASSNHRTKKIWDDAVVKGNIQPGSSVVAFALCYIKRCELHIGNIAKSDREIFCRCSWGTRACTCSGCTSTGSQQQGQ